MWPSAESKGHRCRGALLPFSAINSDRFSRYFSPLGQHSPLFRQNQFALILRDQLSAERIQVSRACVTCEGKPTADKSAHYLLGSNSSQIFKICSMFHVLPISLQHFSPGHLFEYIIQEQLLWMK
jgi:hypothetical protein